MYIKIALKLIKSYFSTERHLCIFSCSHLKTIKQFFIPTIIFRAYCPCFFPPGLQIQLIQKLSEHLFG